MQFNPEQRRVLDWSGRALYVEAIPGSGKTAVLTRLIADRILDGAVHWRQLIAITFTRFAAHEMRERVRAILDKEGDGYVPVRIGTYHSLCFQIVRDHWRELGFASPQIAIYDTLTQNRLIKETIFVSSRKRLPQKVLKGALNTLGSTFEMPTDEETYQLLQRYLRTLREHNAVDYNTLPWLAFNKLWEVSDFHVREIMVDEAQDIDRAQHESFIAMHPDRIVFVGDPDQNIFSWRGGGAPIPDEWACDKITLKQNYRSRQEILDTASRLISHNGRSKEMISIEADSDTMDDDGSWIVTIMEKRHLELNLRARIDEEHSIAILARTNRMLADVSDQLLLAGIGHDVVGQREKLLERTDVRRLIAWLVFPDLPSNPAVFETVVESLGWEQVVVETCRAEAKRVGRTFYELFMEKLDHVRPGLAGAYRELQDQPLIERLIYLNQALGNLGANLHLQDARALRQMVSQFVRSTPHKERTPLNLFAWLNMRDGQDDLIDQDNEALVKLLTCHAAKGLEFDVVFIVGVNQGMMPHGSAVREGNLEEERRLMFVAMTRARRYLYMIYDEEAERSQFETECRKVIAE